MSRAGRKRKNVRREPNGRAQRDGSRDRGTNEFQAHRLRLVGVEHMHDARAGDPLGVLEIEGIVTASQREAAWAWARAMWATYGRPDAPGGPLEIISKGHNEGPSGEMQHRAEVGIAALNDAGHDAYHYVRQVAVEMTLPGWYWRARRGVVRKADTKRQQSFVDGVLALERCMPLGGSKSV